MKIRRRTISKQSVGKPHVIFLHDGNGISPGICRQRTHIKFAFPKKISGKNMGRAIQGKPAETDAKENGKIARVFKGAFKVEGALISSINRNAEWALNTLARLEQTAERRPSVLEAMREQAAKTEPAKKQPASSHDKESR